MPDEPEPEQPDPIHEIDVSALIGREEFGFDDFVGELRPISGSFSGFWDEPAESVNVSMTLRPIGSFTRISNVCYYGQTDSGPLRVFFPTKDRRKARRVARKLKLRFTRGADGYINWRASKPANPADGSCPS